MAKSKNKRKPYAGPRTTTRQGKKKNFAQQIMDEYGDETTIEHAGRVFIIRPITRLQRQKIRVSANTLADNEMAGVDIRLQDREVHDRAWANFHINRQVRPPMTVADLLEMEEIPEGIELNGANLEDMDPDTIFEGALGQKPASMYDLKRLEFFLMHNGNLTMVAACRDEDGDPLYSNDDEMMVAVEWFYENEEILPKVAEALKKVMPS